MYEAPDARGQKIFVTRIDAKHLEQTVSLLKNRKRIHSEQCSENREKVLGANSDIVQRARQNMRNKASALQRPATQSTISSRTVNNCSELYFVTLSLSNWSEDKTDCSFKVCLQENTS